jgi:hypothetical protein
MTDRQVKILVTKIGNKELMLYKVRNNCKNLGEALERALIRANWIDDFEKNNDTEIESF